MSGADALVLEDSARGNQSRGGVQAAANQKKAANQAEARGGQRRHFGLRTRPAWAGNSALSPPGPVRSYSAPIISP
eukprot:784416-Prorocentrum_minimum.AAC.1